MDEIRISNKYRRYIFSDIRTFILVFYSALVAHYSMYEERLDPPCTEFRWNIRSNAVGWITISYN